MTLTKWFSQNTWASSAPNPAPYIMVIIINVIIIVMMLSTEEIKGMIMLDIGKS